MRLKFSNSWTGFVLPYAYPCTPADHFKPRNKLQQFLDQLSSFTLQLEYQLFEVRFIVETLSVAILGIFILPTSCMN